LPFVGSRRLTESGLANIETIALFTTDFREVLRSELVDAGRADPRISGVAITGSASIGHEDRWSDIDLAFGVVEGFELDEILNEFTDRMYANDGALHHLDVHSGNWVYRVFLLSNTLQVDLAFAPDQDFCAKGPTFKLVSGTATKEQPVPPPRAEDLIGWAWLYALHARSCIARGKPWQAEYMISGMRDQVLALACLRCGLPTREGRGLDRLPADITAPLEESLVRSLRPEDLGSAFRSATTGLLREMIEVDSGLAKCLEPTLLALTDTL
jgi:hypothetical protein